jgi:type IV pilus assembly protein PilY1
VGGDLRRRVRDDGNPNSAGYIGDPSDGAFSPKGKSIFIVALDNGDVIANVEHDAAGVDGPAEMLYAIPSEPAVLDLDFDGFADVVYIGDLGGQVWKWDISQVGEDTTGDARVDNWSAGVFFRAYTAATWAGGVARYHNIFFPPSAAYMRGTLTLAFGTGERDDPLYPGAAGTDDNNRFYVAKDLQPTGSGAFPGVLYEDGLTDITGLDSDPNPTDSGFYFIAEEAEKFVTNHTLFAGYVITASFAPPALPRDCSGGGGSRSRLYIFNLYTGLGFFANAVTGDPERSVDVGSGFPTTPRISVGPVDTDVYVQTSDGSVVQTGAPSGSAPPVSIIYWRQVF